MHSLTDLCLNTIAYCLERYPAEAFALLASEEFASIIKVRYNNTLPKKSTNARFNKNNNNMSSNPTLFSVLNDVSGRLSPCVSAKTIREIQTANNHLKGISVSNHALVMDDLLLISLSEASCDHKLDVGVSDIHFFQFLNHPPNVIRINLSLILIINVRQLMKWSGKIACN